jgi:hypothetical protein
MSKIIESERVRGRNGLDIRVVIVENILTDDTPEESSRTYDVETHFYDLASVSPVLKIVDNSPTDYNEASKKFRATQMAMSVFEEAEIE